MQILSYILLEEILVRKSTNGEIWVQHVLDCLQGMLAKDGGSTPILAGSLADGFCMYVVDARKQEKLLLCSGVSKGS